MQGLSPQEYEQRFWKSIRLPERVGTDECWEWQRGHFGNGRAQTPDSSFWGTSLAYRVTWIITHGLIPPGLEVCHHCDNPSCCNPAHLFLGTHQDNMRDSRRKGRARGASFPGEDHPMVKLTELKVKKIRQLYLTGKYSQRQLGRRFGISQRTIGRIVHLRNWKHLTSEKEK